MASKPIIVFVVLVLFSVFSSSYAVPLTAKSRWVIDDRTGKRVKLACANLVGHAESLLPEGLSKQPLSEIVRRTGMMGFNCIRLTYAAHMFTRYNHLTVVENFEKLGLHNALAGISEHNPHILGLTLIEAQKAVIDEFGSQGIMMVLDNQVSKPLWCCADDDGNGFFGDKYFDPNEWLDSLTIVAKLYRYNPMVIGMSLRNEIRGPKQNERVWYEYIEKGARAVHKANPDVLVIISGLNYAIRLEFLKQRPLNLHFKHKLMYETHRYAFSEGNSPQFENQAALNGVCHNVSQEIEDKVGFLSRGKHAAPIFVSEWGLNQVSKEIAEHTFFTCFLSYLAENDYEWSLWTLQGSYYYRQGSQDPEEQFGMFNLGWDSIRNPDVNSKLLLVQQALHDPFSNATNSYVMFHPLSGKCVRVDNGEIHLSECIGMARWSRGHPNEPSAIELQGSGWCLTGVGHGQPVGLTQDCKSKKSSWRQLNKYQLSYVGEDGQEVCLEWNPYYSLKLVTKKCIIFREGSKPEDPQRQWFNLVRSTAQ